MSAAGVLVLVGTPIGNMDDLSPRAAAALAAADVIACEDTRRTGGMLHRLGIERPKLIVVNEHTEADEIPRLLARLDAGERLALVSDAGMPGISDPGERLVAAAAAAGHRVEVVPGPSSVLAALVLSGLPTARFVVEGFLPRKGAARAERVAAVAAEVRTVVLLEAPHRIERTLVDLVGVCGSERRAAIARELTKLHEEVRRGTLGDLLAWAADGVRGELVLVLDGAPAAPPPDDDVLRAALRVELDAGATTRDAVDAVAREHDVARGRVYDLARDR